MKPFSKKREYTTEEKRSYFKVLRESWNQSKALAKQDKVAEALFRESGLKGISYWSFYFVLKQMKELGLEGLPYIDMKTFDGWKETGFMVNKGETSKASGITWLKFGGKKADEQDEDNDVHEVLVPKRYHLFHLSLIHI